jgi:hypothetical protein
MMKLVNTFNITRMFKSIYPLYVLLPSIWKAEPFQITYFESMAPTTITVTAQELEKFGTSKFIVFNKSLVRCLSTKGSATTEYYPGL